MSRNHSSGSIFSFIVGIGVGVAAVILLGSKRVDELHDDLSEALNDGLDQVQSKTRDLKRQAQKTIHNTQQKVQQAIDAGSSAYNETKNS
jgi:Sec-independent protein translocase protein TatA